VIEDGTVTVEGFDRRQRPGKGSTRSPCSNIFPARPPSGRPAGSGGGHCPARRSSARLAGTVTPPDSPTLSLPSASREQARPIKRNTCRPHKRRRSTGHGPLGQLYPDQVSTAAVARPGPIRTIVPATTGSSARSAHARSQREECDSPRRTAPTNAYCANPSARSGPRVGSSLPIVANPPPRPRLRLKSRRGSPCERAREPR
jgi:hypothetical protein